MYAFKNPPPRTRRFAFGPLDRITIRDREYRWHQSDEAGHLLIPVTGVDDAVPEGFLHSDLDALALKGELLHEADFYDEKRSLLRMKSSGANALFDLSEDEQRIILRRQEILDLLRRQQNEDLNFKRTDAYLKEALKKITVTMVDRSQARASKGRVERCDQSFEFSKMPSTRTIRRWWKLYESSGYDVMALRDGHYRSGNEFSSLSPDVVRLINKHAAGWADTRRPTMAGQYELLVDEMRKINKTRRVDEQLKPPAKNTFRKAIKAIPAFAAHAGRYGLDAAKRRFAVVGAGLETVRAFQRLTMDGHKVQLSTIAVKIEDWEGLSREEKAKAARERLMLHLSLDGATRCVTGIRLSPTENSETALSLLRMCVTDKSRYAIAAGCKSDWPMTARPGTVATDTGSAWISTDFRSAVAGLRASVECAPVGLPQMRGQAERLFGTIDRGLLPAFSGRTFGSIEEKGDYDPGKQSSVFSERLGFAFVRWIVDKYHHTPHAALNGQTPYDKWCELVDRYGVLPPPSKTEVRCIFGVKLERALDHRGIRAVGIHYQSERLQEFRRRVGDVKVAVRLDPEDLGAVSVFVDEKWLTVPAVGSFDGVNLAVWQEAARDLRRRNLIQASLRQDIVGDALRDIAKMGRAAMAYADVTASTVTAEEVMRAEREVLYGFDIVENERSGPSPTEGRDADGNRDRFANSIPIEDHPPGDASAAAPDSSTAPIETPSVKTRTRNSNIKFED